MSSTSNNNGEAFTHPQLYREYINHPPMNKNNNNKNIPKKTEANKDESTDKHSYSGSEDEWDLYPKIVRDIENHGTPEQVEHLHQLEKTPSRH
ncbi:unnamed protein product [Cunninghamella blakesleeana]